MELNYNGNDEGKPKGNFEIRGEAIPAAKTKEDPEYIVAHRFLEEAGRLFREDLRKVIVRYSSEFFIPAETLLGVLEEVKFDLTEVAAKHRR